MNGLSIIPVLMSCRVQNGLGESENTGRKRERPKAMAGLLPPEKYPRSEGGLGSSSHDFRTERGRDIQIAISDQSAARLRKVVLEVRVARRRESERRRPDSSR